MNGWRAAALAAAAVVLGANAWHILAQSGSPWWDDAWYLENSFRFYHALGRGLGDFVAEYAGAFKIKAPLISVLPLPVYLLLGPSETNALWVNQGLFAATLFLVYRVGRALYGEKAGCAAVVGTALTPLLYGLSRLFLVECLLTCLVLLAQWLILERRAGKRGAALLGASLGLGLLAKVLLPLYLLGSFALKRRELKADWRVAAAVAALVASTWYAFNAVYVVGFALSAARGAVIHVTGEGAGWTALRLYLQTLCSDAVSWPGLAAAALLLGLAWRTRPRGWRPGPSELFLGAWLGLPLAAMCVGHNKDIRFMAPALPALALAAGAAAAALSERRRWGAWCGLAALPLVWVLAGQTFGGREPFFFNGPPKNPRFDRAAIVAAAPRGVVAVAAEHRHLNANNLASLAALRDLPVRFISLGYGQPSVEGALIRLKDKGADHVLLVDGLPPAELPAYLNRANEGLRERLQDGRLPAERLATVPVGEGATATLYRLTAAPPRASAPARGPRPAPRRS